VKEQKMKRQQIKLEPASSMIHLPKLRITIKNRVLYFEAHTVWFRFHRYTPIHFQRRYVPVSLPMALVRAFI